MPTAETERPPEPPLVSVVTPVYNTAAYLRECIESVLRQTWPRLEYVVVDNRSTDGSREIAEEYARRVGWIRVVSNTRHLGQVDNFNHALCQISSVCKYTKVVAADDWIYPECIERMARVAEMRESIALVGSFTLTATWIDGVGLPYGVSVFTGRDVCRRQLLKRQFFFGSPSSVLYRSALVRAHDPFYDRESLHSDTERAYQLLRDHDFGFVHQVLSFRREDPESFSGRVTDLDPHEVQFLISLLKYGRDFLTREEFAGRLGQQEARYCRLYLQQVMGPHRSRFLAYHRPALAALGYRFPASVVARATSMELVDLVFNPKKTAARLMAILRQFRRRS